MAKWSEIFLAIYSGWPARALELVKKKPNRAYPPITVVSAEDKAIRFRRAMVNLAYDPRPLSSKTLRREIRRQLDQVH